MKEARMADKVRCPKCGNLVRSDALDRHLRFMCPKRDGVAVVPEAKVHQPTSSLPSPAEATPSVADVMGRLRGAASSTVTAPSSQEAPTAVISPTRPIPTVSSQVEKRRIIQSDDPLPIPPPEVGFWISEPHKAAAGRVVELSAEGDVVNVLITGATGCGKTTFARQFAAEHARPFFEMHCGAIVDVEQWFGKDRLIDGETLYRKNRFVQAIETADCVILLDEINRAHPEQLNAILGLLDWRRSIHNDDLGYTIRVADGVVFFATMNQGVDYYGVNPLDNAVKDRFPRVLKLSYPPEEREVELLKVHGIGEDVAKKLCRFATQLRNATVPVPISPRQLRVAAEELRLGATLREAIELSVINRLDDTSLQMQALEALQLIDDNPYVDEDEFGQEEGA